MYEILNASEMGGLDYTNPSLAYFEIRGNEFCPVASRIGLAGGSAENTIKSAALRVRSGESLLMAASGDKYGNITFIRIDDIDELLLAYGLGEKSDHRHQLRWEYSSIDDGKSLFADVDLVFLCGCHLNCVNKRTRNDELRKQYGLEIRLSDIGSLVDSDRVRVGIKRKGLRDKDKELK